MSDSVLLSRLRDIPIGHAGIRWDVIVYRTGKDAFVVGETIKVKSDERLTAEQALKRIQEIKCQEAAISGGRM